MDDREDVRRERLLIIALAAVTATILTATLLLPRPDVRVASFQVTPGPCSGSARLASATYVLENRGGSDGTVIVEVLADGQWLKSSWHRVPAGARTTHAVSVPVPDCEDHVYGYLMCYPPSEMTPAEKVC